MSSAKKSFEIKVNLQTCPNNGQWTEIVNGKEIGRKNGCFFISLSQISELCGTNLDVSTLIAKLGGKRDIMAITSNYMGNDFEAEQPIATEKLHELANSLKSVIIVLRVDVTMRASKDSFVIRDGEWVPADCLCAAIYGNYYYAENVFAIRSMNEHYELVNEEMLFNFQPDNYLVPRESKKVNPRSGIPSYRPRIERIEPRIERIEPRIERIEPRIERIEPRIERIEPVLASLQAPYFAQIREVSLVDQKRNAKNEIATLRAKNQTLSQKIKSIAKEIDSMNAEQTKILTSCQDNDLSELDGVMLESITMHLQTLNNEKHEMSRRIEQIQESIKSLELVFTLLSE
jgi:hypothetical protein